VTRPQGLLVAFAVAVLAVGATAAYFIFQSISVVTIENRGATAVHLAVGTTRPGPFRWSGSLRPGGQVTRTARFSDNTIEVVCTDATGRYRSASGYVTSGMPQVVQVSVNGCAAISIDILF